MDHVVSTNIKNNQVNDDVDNALKFESNSSLAIPIRDPQPVTTFNLTTIKIL